METRLDIFISSKMQELKAERDLLFDLIPTLNRGLVELNAWVFEKNAPASAKSIREEYLKVLKGSVLYIGLFWNQYGEWTIDEFDKAAEWGIDRHIYVKDVDAEKRDEKLQAFLQKHGDVEHGITAKWYKTLDELREAVTNSLARWLEEKLTPRPGDLSATVARTPDAIPHQPRKLIGREELQANIHQRLDAGESVLLRGFSGMGKTALAAVTAAERMQKTKNPALWLRAGSESGDSLFEALARPFNAHQAIAAASGDDKTALLKSILAGCGAGLLVLDDVWDGRAFKQIMDAVPNGLPVLATSRHSYPLDGELFRVGELSPEKALETLGYYAREDYSHDPAAAELCKRLGYHAFALEIAGRTLHAERDANDAKLKPEALTRRIADAPHSLTLPGEFAEPGRESIAGLLDVSLNALDDAAKAVFVAMGAFFAPQITAEMLALYFIDDIPQVGDQEIVEFRKNTPNIRQNILDYEIGAHLQGQIARTLSIDISPIESALKLLVRHGLVDMVRETKDSGQYYRLHDLAYSYAWAQNTKEAHRRALDTCLNYTWRHNESSPLNFAALRPELDNFLGAANWAMLAEYYAAVEQLAWNLSSGEGSQYFHSQWAYVEASNLLQQAVIAAEKQKNFYSKSAHLSHLGNIYSHRGHYEKALQSYKSSMQIIRDFRIEDHNIINIGGIGNVFADLGKYGKALRFYKKALRIARKFGDPVGEANTLGNIGRAYRNLGKNQEAIRFYEQALAMHRELGKSREVANALTDIGIIYRESGKTRKAILFHKEALAIHRSIGDRKGEGVDLDALGIAYSDLKEYKVAEECFEQALAIQRDTDDRLNIGATLGNIGKLNYHQRNYNLALEYYTQARMIFASIGNRELVEKTDPKIAEVQAKLSSGE